MANKISLFILLIDNLAAKTNENKVIFMISILWSLENGSNL